MRDTTVARCTEGERAQILESPTGNRVPRSFCCPPASGGSHAPGFGTIEVLIALSLFSVAVLTIGGLLILSLSTGTVAETSSIATNLARARMEALLSREPTELAGEDDSTSTQRVPAGYGPSYTVHTTVGASHPDLLDITVTVTWRVASGPACVLGALGGGCKTSETNHTRMLQSRLRGPSAP